MHIGTCQSVLGYPCTLTRHDPMHTSVESSYLLYLQNQCTVRKNRQKKENKVISGYMPISPGALHILLVGLLAPCSRLPGCAGCTSSPTCSEWWCAGVYSHRSVLMKRGLVHTKGSCQLKIILTFCILL